MPYEMQNQEKIDQFAKANHHAQVTVESELIKIQKPWGRGDWSLNLEASDANYSLLGNLTFDSRFDAIFHQNENQFEFPYAFVISSGDKKNELIGREFSFHYKGVELNCSFSEPSESMMMVTKGLERNRGEALVGFSQIDPFRDFHKFDSLPDRVKLFFENRIPLCFYLKPSKRLDHKDWPRLCKTLNFLMRYYDRESPLILIHEDPSGSTSSTKEIRYVLGEFPNVIKAREYDDTLMLLRESAILSSPRLSFVYCYNILEYCAYYYVDFEIKEGIECLLRDPSVIACCHTTISKMTTMLSKMNQSDDFKIKKVMEYFGKPQELWKEVEQDRGFFSQDLKFDGGLNMPALVNKEMNEESWSKTWVTHLFDHITKIRNVLVHAREKRESVSITPTKRNNGILSHYIPLMRRLSEQMIINHQQ